jgi:hypothetical protein
MNWKWKKGHNTLLDGKSKSSINFPHKLCLGLNASNILLGEGGGVGFLLCPMCSQYVIIKFLMSFQHIP